MDTIIGICGDDFALLATDSYVQYSIIRLQKNVDKIYEIDGDKLLATAGQTADRCSFGEYVQKNLHLNRLRNQGRPLGPSAAANFARTELAEALRKGPYQVDTILAGWDQGKQKAEMFWLDWFGTLCSAKKAAHGYGGHFLMGLLDRYYKDGITETEAIELLKKCIEELKERFLIAQSAFTVKIVNKDGIRLIAV